MWHRQLRVAAFAHRVFSPIARPMSHWLTPGRASSAAVAPCKRAGRPHGLDFSVVFGGEDGPHVS